MMCLILTGGVALADEESEEGKEEEKEEIQEGKFLALPIFITEPAIGEGLGVGLVYFHPQKPVERPKILTGKGVQRVGRRSKPPPTASGVFAAYTSNDTSAIGFGHARSMMNDKYRFIGAIASLNVNATVFASDIPFDFNIEGNLIFSSIKRRFGNSNVFLGLSVSSLDADVKFKLGGNGNTPPIEFFDYDFRQTGLALSGIYDARDDTMMPSSGQLVDLTTWWYDDAIGSDFDYTSIRLKAHSFHQLNEKFVLGYRFYASTVSGEPIFDTENTIRAAGAGLRYQALKAQNVWVGLDFARGPEEDAWYIQVGHPW